MIKAILLTTFFGITNLSVAQNLVPNNTITQPQSVKKNTSNLEINFTPKQIIELDTHLNKGEFQELFTYLQRSKVSNSFKIKYLLSKQSYGYVPTYWLISDMYAKERNYPETHKWFYISLIMTQQDSYLCSDNTAKNAPRKLMEYFPDSVHITRHTPQYIEQAMREVAFFISNLHSRISPEWVCHYGENNPQQYPSITIERRLWKDKRLEVYNNFMSKYQK